MKKNQRGNGKGREGEGGQKPRLSEEEKTARKVKLVVEDKYAVVPRRALETNDMIALVSKNDYLVNRLRVRIGTDDRIEGGRAVELLRVNRGLRDQLNQQNADLCQVMGMDYDPPRGFENPLANSQDAKEKRARKEPAPSSVLEKAFVEQEVVASE